jgi:hypothetical protein
VGYRDDREQLQVRVELLEGELSDAEERIERLTGARASMAAGDIETTNRILDAPGFVKRVRELDFEVTEDGLEAIADLIRARTGQPVYQVGRTLTGTGFSLRQEEGRTIVELKKDFSGLTAGAAASSVLVGGFASMAGLALWHDLVMRSVSEANILWIAPIVIVAAFAGFRKISQTKARGGAQKLSGTFEAVLELAERHLAESETRARVEADADVATEVEDPVEVPDDSAAEESA